MPAIVLGIFCFIHHHHYHHHYLCVCVCIYNMCEHGQAHGRVIVLGFENSILELILSFH